MEVSVQLHASAVSNILHHLVFKHLQYCSAHNVRDQVSHPYKTRGNIIVLYILIFKFFDRRGMNDPVNKFGYTVKVVLLKHDQFQTTGIQLNKKR
jgi:hypothetical protein